MRINHVWLSRLTENGSAQRTYDDGDDGDDDDDDGGDDDDHRSLAIPLHLVHLLHHFQLQFFVFVQLNQQNSGQSSSPSSRYVYIYHQ